MIGNMEPPTITKVKVCLKKTLTSSSDEKTEDMDPWGSNEDKSGDDQSEKTFDSNFCVGNDVILPKKEKSMLNDNYSNKLGKEKFNKKKLIFTVFSH